MSCRDIRTSKTLAVVVAIDKSDDVAKAGFLGEPDFTPSDRYVYMAPNASLYHTHQRDVVEVFHYPGIKSSRNRCCAAILVLLTCLVRFANLAFLSSPKCTL